MSVRDNWLFSQSLAQVISNYLFQNWNMLSFYHLPSPGSVDWVRILHWPQNAIICHLFFFLQWFMYVLVIPYSFLCGSVFCYETMCSFAVMTLCIQSIVFVKAVVSQPWKCAIPTVRSERLLYQPVGSEELSPYPEVSLMLHNRRRSERVQTQAPVLSVQNWVDYS